MQVLRFESFVGRAAYSYRGASARHRRARASSVHSLCSLERRCCYSPSASNTQVLQCLSDAPGSE